ncbi:MAG: methylmalonyl-CoA mutase family protein [candidate division Zixibacteria bacterium]|nr:methylmalonyl-CoA mutase family protein [candidate division Zixibacteria bacterium]
MPTEKPEGKPTERNRMCLLEEFPVPEYKDWLNEVERLLKGAPFEKRMLTRTYENITLQPLYHKEDTQSISDIDSYPGFSPFIRGSRIFRQGEHAWETAQEINYPTPVEFNRAVRYDLERGLTAVTLPLDKASRKGLDADAATEEEVGCEGVSLSSLADLTTALEGISLDRVPVFFQACDSSLFYLASYVALAKEKGYDIKYLKGAVAYDPLGELAQAGVLSGSLETVYDEMAAAVSWAEDHAPLTGVIWVHGEIYSDAGASAVWELALTVSAAVEYLRAMEKRGLEIEQVLPHIRFSLGLGTNFFMESAKLRAARCLWNRILENCGVSEEKRSMGLHARTSRCYQTKFDPYVNLLRLTTGAFSGAVGGADSMQVAAFDERIRPADEFSRRLSRNIQVILKDEAKLARVLDPAGGSWYVERLTHEIVLETWRIFRQIEEKGGLFRALQEGFPQKAVEKTIDERRNAYASRKDVLVGTNKYPQPDEELLEPGTVDFSAVRRERLQRLQEIRKTVKKNKPVETVLGQLLAASGKDRKEIFPLVVEAVEGGATVGEIMIVMRRDKNEIVRVAPFPVYHAAEPFEKLRLAVMKMRLQKGNLKVFLATLGEAGAYMPRLDFAASFFEVGGFEVVRTEGFETPGKAAEEALKSRAEVVVICGRDEIYPESVPVIAEQVKKARPHAIVVLAGLPGDDKLKKRFSDAGVDIFIHIKTDILEVLNETAVKLGVLL